MSSKKAKPKGSKTAKKTASEKPADKTASTKGRGVRYDNAKKQEVIDFVSSYNQQNGRGGQSAAARKYGVTILTVSSWLKGSGKTAAKAPKEAATSKAAKAPKAPKAAKASASLTGKVKTLLDLSDRISKAEAELQKLQGQYSSLSASIRAEI